MDLWVWLCVGAIVVWALLVFFNEDQRARFRLHVLPFVVMLVGTAVAYFFEGTAAGLIGLAVVALGLVYSFTNVTRFGLGD